MQTLGTLASLTVMGASCAPPQATHSSGLPCVLQAQAGLHPRPGLPALTVGPRAATAAAGGKPHYTSIWVFRERFFREVLRASPKTSAGLCLESEGCSRGGGRGQGCCAH